MASTDVTFVATFFGAERKGSSANGNPSWELNTSAGFYRTETDGQIGYSVSNYIGRSEYSLVGQEVEFTATKAGRVKEMKRA